MMNDSLHRQLDRLAAVTRLAEVAEVEPETAALALAMAAEHLVQQEPRRDGGAEEEST
jgi:hypothetical protein